MSSAATMTLVAVILGILIRSSYFSQKKYATLIATRTRSFFTP